MIEVSSKFAVSWLIQLNAHLFSSWMIFDFDWNIDELNCLLREWFLLINAFLNFDEPITSKVKLFIVFTQMNTSFENFQNPFLKVFSFICLN